MTDMFWSEELQNRLKQTRLDAGISAEDLARFCALSVAQLVQLENGGESLFYSPQIKYRSGVKALKALIELVQKEQSPFGGLPAPATLYNTPPDSFHHSTEQRLDRVAQLQPARKKPVEQERPAHNSLQSKLYLVGAIVVACLSLFLMLEHDLQTQAKPNPSHVLPASSPALPLDNPRSNTN